MATGRITQMGYVALRTRDLTASIKDATEVFGLRLSGNDSRKAFLSAADTHHELVYIQDDADTADHFGVIAPDLAELEAIRAKVDRAGYRIVSEQPIEDHIEQGFAFVGPEGYTWQVYTPVRWYDRRAGEFGPDRYGHINIRALDSVGMTKFLIDVFEMRVSDRIGHDAAFFLRCSTEHHAVAVAKSDRTALHHHAWLTQSIVDLGRLGDRLARRGRRLLWGPLRHGAGHNIAAYYVEPNGTVVELYTDMEHIYDDSREPIVWSDDDAYWINQWDGLTQPSVRSFGTVPFQR